MEEKCLGEIYKSFLKSEIDILTGLYNRYSFEEKIKCKNN